MVFLLEKFLTLDLFCAAYKHLIFKGPKEVKNSYNFLESFAVQCNFFVVKKMQLLHIKLPSETD